MSFLRTCKHKRAGNLLERMLDEQFMAEVYFLCDIFGHLEKFWNLEVQGREKSIADLVEKPCAFKTKLAIFKTDLTTKILHFPHLRAVLSTAPGAHITRVMTDMSAMSDFFVLHDIKVKERMYDWFIPYSAIQYIH